MSLSETRRGRVVNRTLRGDLRMIVAGALFALVFLALSIAQTH